MWDMCDTWCFSKRQTSAGWLWFPAAVKASLMSVTSTWRRKQWLAPYEEDNLPVQGCACSSAALYSAVQKRITKGDVTSSAPAAPSPFHCCNKLREQSSQLAAGHSA